MADRDRSSDGGAPRLEVLVPSYNHAQFIEQCLQSIFDQTEPPARLLVIDDGSRDGSPPIIERTLARCPFPCEMIVRPNRGLCATLNEGLARTGGEYFAYLGSDDVWHPRRLELGARALDQSPDAVLSHSNFLLFDDQDEMIGDSTFWGEYRDGLSLDDLLRGRSIPQSTTVTYRRSVLDRIGWNEKSRLEDYELFLRLAHRGPFAFIPHTLGYWRQHGDNVSKQVEMMLDAMVEAQERVSHELGIGPGALAANRGALRFRHANYILRHGSRTDAIRLTLANLRHAPTLAGAFRQLLRMAAPRRLLERRERLTAARQRKRDCPAG